MCGSESGEEKVGEEVEVGGEAFAYNSFSCLTIGNK